MRMTWRAPSLTVTLMLSQPASAPLVRATLYSPGPVLLTAPTVTTPCPPGASAAVTELMAYAASALPSPFISTPMMWAMGKPTPPTPPSVKVPAPEPISQRNLLAVVDTMASGTPSPLTSQMETSLGTSDGMLIVWLSV